MDNPKKNTENEQLGSTPREDNSNRPQQQRTDNCGSDSLNEGRSSSTDEDSASSTGDTDKYLAMEQPGVQYTKETDPAVNSDQMDFNEQSAENKWNSEGGNSSNSDAFNQDDYILNDNVDLDEDQNQSISSDDEDFEESNERYTN